MNLRFAFLVAFVVFVATPSLEFIGARAQIPADEEQCAAACDAADRTDPSVIQAFIIDGISLCDCVCNADGEGLLHISVENQCGVCISLLTSSPSNCPCDDTDNNGNTPLHLAASICDGARTSDTINAGCNVDAINNGGDTSLCLVSRRTSGSECGQVVRTILASEADSCIRCSGNTTACESCGFGGTCDILDQDRACINCSR
eukprot:g355.t1